MNSLNWKEVFLISGDSIRVAAVDPFTDMAEL